MVKHMYFKTCIGRWRHSAVCWCGDQSDIHDIRSPMGTNPEFEYRWFESAGEKYYRKYRYHIVASVEAQHEIDMVVVADSEAAAMKKVREMFVDSCTFGMMVRDTWNKLNVMSSVEIKEEME